MTEFSRFTPLVQSLPATVPFVGPETQERQVGKPFRARIGANENGFGPAPSVKDAIRAGAEDIWKYCDPENHDLRAALGAHLGVPMDRIAIGEGIDGLLGLIVRQVVLPGTPVVTSLGAYPTFNYHVAGFGGRLVTVPYRDDKEDLEGLLEAVRRENAPLVYLANPDNPMGTWHSAQSVAAFADALPEDTLLVLDEAYCETAPPDALPAIDRLADMPNVLRLRTFSKGYGLAGLRCGYAIGSLGTITSFKKVCNHFGVNRMAQIAALAAVNDQDYLRSVCERIETARRRLYRIGRDNGFEPLGSATNFVAIDCGRDGAFTSQLLNALMERGVFVRKPGVPPLDRCIRISVGPDSDLDIFEEELRNVMVDLS
ncbi:pyridoxal phosphate-dependent aminotransferase [Hoeflea prorocentri]|uniref:histidinol-phosphate transaminase n=1 Tax=Hoeflea prorocentri TaxID=1922333 RepID=A0A9X3ULY5_9HYPH|nr:pyridoxal phosphate-dependent aminotransferase [Hoeflea prorocentri]MCY6382991.1 pyridoxal phosphate-dependent aminotransferase [Hoeflea prorocentri]MDA5400791.1 pyridoxal phosphate-dependent aminotransferase [Hoeflea prorocentri]